MKREFKVGDRVRVYGLVTEINATGGAPVYMGVSGKINLIKQHTGKLVVDVEGLGTYLAHPKQCRRLIKKQKRRVWINEKWLQVSLTKTWSDVGSGAAIQAPLIICSKDKREGFIEFIEVTKPRRGE